MGNINLIVIRYTDLMLFQKMMKDPHFIQEFCFEWIQVQRLKSFPESVRDSSRCLKRNKWLKIHSDYMQIPNRTKGCIGNPTGGTLTRRVFCTHISTGYIVNT